MSKHEIPEAVKKEASYFLENYKGYLYEVGLYNGDKAYTFHFEEDLDLGYPEVYIHQQAGVFTITGSMALTFLDRLRE